MKTRNGIRRTLSPHLEPWWRLSDDLLCVIGPQGAFRAVNDAWERKLGWRGVDLIGSSPYALVHPDDLAFVAEAHGSAHASDRMEPVEVRFRHVNGTYRWLVWSGARERGFLYASGRDIGAGGTLAPRDVAERELVRRERHSKALLLAFPDGLCVVDGNGQIVEVNDGLCEMTGFTRDELVGARPPLPLWPQDNAERHVDAFWKAMRDGKGHYGLDLRRADDSRFPAAIDVSGLVNEDGTTEPGFLCVVRDVTTTVEEQRWLRQTHAVARLTSWEWDPADERGEIKFGVVGFAPLNLPRRATLDDLLASIPDPHADNLSNGLRQVAAGGEEAVLEFPALLENGDTSWVETRLHPVRDASGRVLRVRGTTQDITARKLAELAGAKSRARLKRAQRLANVGDFELDDRTRKVTWSLELYRLFDIEPGSFGDELDAVWEMFPPEDAEALAEVSARTVADGQSRQFEHRYMRGDEVRWAETRIEPLSEDGQRGGLRGTMQDITERKRTEHEMQLQANVLDAVDVAVVVADPEGVVTHWNRGAERLYGWTSEETVGRPIQDFAGRPADEATMEAIFTALRETGHYEGEAEVSNKAGDVFPVYNRNSFFTSPDGEVLGIVGLSVDISERVEADRRLKAARDHLQAITQSMGEGLFTLDTDGRLTYLNRAGEEMLGWTERELLGKSMHELAHFRRPDGSPCPEEDCPLLNARRHGEIVRTDDDLLIRKDGTDLPVEMTAAPFETADGVRGSVVVFSDISQRKAEQLRLRKQLDAVSWVGRIRDALDEDRFVLHAQPIVDLRSGETVQHELLIRMMGVDGRLVAPGLFLPAAEEYGLIADIDRWVVGQAMEIASAGHAVELNLSAHSVAGPGLIEHFERELDRTGADPSLLVVELTETALLNDERAAELFIERLGALGCKLALDDFGTGYGGFSYLKRLPVDFLKIDMEFVRDLPVNAASQHVVKAVVSLAKGFGQQTVAEGVEDEETLRLLSEFEVDYAQGFAIARPAPVDEALAAPDAS